MLVHNWAGNYCFTGSLGLQNKLFNLSGLNSSSLDLGACWHPWQSCSSLLYCARVGLAQERRVLGWWVLPNQCSVSPFVSPAFRWVEFCLPSGWTSQPLERRVAGIISPSWLGTFQQVKQINTGETCRCHLLFIMSFSWQSLKNLPC